MNQMSLKAIRAVIKKRGYPDTTVERCSGRSTTIALETIAEAMKTPDKSVRVKDHHPSAQADNHLADMICEYIDRLGFSGFKLDRAPLLLVFSLEDSA
jgi:hypothetical protein